MITCKSTYCMIWLHLHLSNLNCSVCVVLKISYMYCTCRLCICTYMYMCMYTFVKLVVTNAECTMYVYMFTNFKFCSLVVLQFNDPVLFLPPSPSHPLRLLLPSSHTGYTHLVMVEMTGAVVVSSHQITTGNWCVLGDQVSIHAV